ncbi:nitrate reductase [Bradyrhizobium liaoningense]|uniref:nitrate reductase n=1 Tax=Bradyrhizobium liaoningense TaxID=43992 RepID=UPI001BA4E416|nr:nitrate reductase [Bradyrhizobium liaoningense]MBR0854126.1 molybdopterin-dependent oxidoreductase [Bradyrhizobium liaoningense]
MNTPSPHPPTTVRTTCPYCGVGCGILAAIDRQGNATISGDPAHPANFGRLCSKGSALGETLSLDQRLLHPMFRQADGSFARTDWDTALSKIANGLRTIVDRDGPNAIALYLSGQLLTEDYYVANKLMKGFLGSPNVDTNSRLCMASPVAGHRRAFGADVVPGIYRDLDEADLIVLVGSNAAWCHPVLYQRMIAAKNERSTRLVVIDPRRTATADAADLFLPIASGMDTALFCGLLAYLADTHALDDSYIAEYTSGFADALARARAIANDAEAAARATRLDPGEVARFFELFARTERVVTCYSQGVNQSAQGTDKVNAIINTHLATGRIGRPGMGPFSLTGQPNAMGGREVGGLANQLAAHMGFSPGETDRVRRFWNAPRMATGEGLKAVDMFDAIERGTIKALWVMATNPAVSLPRAGAVRAALKKLELFVVSETTLRNDTVEAGAHVLLPAAAWGEKDGTVTNSERRISRQRAFLPRPGEAQPDWWIVSKVAQRLGFGAGFAYRKPAEIFREHAALSAFENDGRRDFDLGDLAALPDDDYDRLDPVMWPVKAGAAPGEVRFFSAGGFFTSDGRGRFIAPEPPRTRVATSDAFPLRLNTGRLRDQWHTMTRSGKSPRLGAHSPEPMVDIHPDDASRMRITDGGFAKVTTPHGSAVLRVCIRSGQQRGSIFAPIHWSQSTAADACVGALAMAETDPFSGQPELKATPARVEPVEFAYRGFALTRDLITLPNATWFARVAVAGGHGLLFATNELPSQWQDLAEKLICGDAERAEYVDLPRGIVRIAALRGGRIEACMFFGPSHNPPAWEVVRALFNSGTVTRRDRRLLLSGQSAEGIAETGPVVCACYTVGLEAIRRAVAEGGAANVADIGRALRAGTNCGSCIPELQAIIERTASAVGSGTAS